MTSWRGSVTSRCEGPAACSPWEVGGWAETGPGGVEPWAPAEAMSWLLVGGNGMSAG